MFQTPCEGQKSILRRFLKIPFWDLFLTFVVTSSLYRFLKIPFWDLFLTFVAHPRFSGLWGRPFWDLCSYQLSKRGWVRGPLLLSAFMGEVVMGTFQGPSGPSGGGAGRPLGWGCLGEPLPPCPPPLPLPPPRWEDCPAVASQPPKYKMHHPDVPEPPKHTRRGKAPNCTTPPVTKFPKHPRHKRRAKPHEGGAAEARRSSPTPPPATPHNRFTRRMQWNEKQQRNRTRRAPRPERPQPPRHGPPPAPGRRSNTPTRSTAPPNDAAHPPTHKRRDTPQQTRTGPQARSPQGKPKRQRRGRHDVVQMRHVSKMLLRLRG